LLLNELKAILSGIQAKTVSAAESNINKDFQQPQDKKVVTFNHLNVIVTLVRAVLIKKSVPICFFITLRHVG
jgi:hypothetical protein